MAETSHIALVTGTGSGIGRAVALKLQAAGFHVALLGRRLSELEKTAAEAKTGGGKFLVVPADVTDERAVKAAFAKTLDSFRRLDLLFNNAGTFSQGASIDELALEEWQRVVDVNLTGPFLCAREAIRIMKAQQPDALSTTARFRRRCRGLCLRPTRRRSTPSQGSRNRFRSMDERITSRARKSISETLQRISRPRWRTEFYRPTAASWSSRGWMSRTWRMPCFTSPTCRLMRTYCS